MSVKSAREVVKPMDKWTALALPIARLGKIGRFPTMPGTAATGLVGIPAAVVLSWFSPPWSHGLLGLLFFLACAAADLAARHCRQSDPSEVVVDELVGFLVTMIGLPVSLWSLALGFAAFRLFDIGKPWPVRALDRELHGGLGIVLDDVAAGIYAHALVWTLLWGSGRPL